MTQPCFYGYVSTFETELHRLQNDNVSCLIVHLKAQAFEKDVFWLLCDTGSLLKCLVYVFTTGCWKQQLKAFLLKHITLLVGEQCVFYHPKCTESQILNQWKKNGHYWVELTNWQWEKFSICKTLSLIMYGLCINDGVWNFFLKECFNLHGRHDFLSKTSADLAMLLCRELINLYSLICALKAMQIRKVRASKNKSRTTKLYPQKAVPGITFP